MDLAKPLNRPSLWSPTAERDSPSRPTQETFPEKASTRKLSLYPIIALPRRSHLGTPVNPQYVSIHLLCLVNNSPSDAILVSSLCFILSPGTCSYTPPLHIYGNQPTNGQFAYALLTNSSSHPLHIRSTVRFVSPPLTQVDFLDPHDLKSKLLV